MLNLITVEHKIYLIQFYCGALGKEEQSRETEDWPFMLCNPKPSLKIGTANTICWNSLGLFRDYGLNYIYLRMKLFCFSR
jgi:hypothetical protein